MTDSRKEFEEWCYINWNFWITVRKGDGYENEDVNNMWRGWKGGRQSVAKGERTAFEQAKLQEEVEALNLRVVRMVEALKEISGVSNVTATDKRFIYELQNMASVALFSEDDKRCMRNLKFDNTITHHEADTQVPEK